MNIFEKALGLLRKGKVENKAKQYADCIIFDVFGNLLLMERSSQDDFEPSKWCLPGGKIEAGEDPMTAAYRELDEETGIKGIMLTTLESVKREGSESHYFIGFLTNNPPLLLDNEEHYRYQFVPVSELADYELLLDLGDVLASMNLEQYSINHTEICSYHERIISDATVAQVQKAFDKDQISDEDYVKFMLISKSLETIEKGHSQGLLNDKQFQDAIEKSKHYEFVKVVRDGKHFFQYRLVGSEVDPEENMEVGGFFDDAKTGLKVTKYSDKSFLISGNTFKNLELLRSIKEEIGMGTFNKTLGGWVYPSNSKEKIMSFLAEKMDVSTYEGTVAKENAIAIKNAVDIGTEVTLNDQPGTITEVTAEAGKPVYTVETEKGEVEVKEEDIAIVPATEEKAIEIINSVDEESRFKAGKELTGKEQAETSVAQGIEFTNESARELNEAELKSFTTRSGEAIEALDYSHINQSSIQLVNQEDILDVPRPSWCPQINEPFFYGAKDDSFVFDYVKLNDENLLLALNGFEKKSWNIPVSDHKIINKELQAALASESFTYEQIKRDNNWGNDTDGYRIEINGQKFHYDNKLDWQKDKESIFNNVNASYAVVSLDQIVAIQDYYTKRRKALIEKKKNDDTEKALDRLRNMDDAKLTGYQAFSYTRLSEKQKKKYSKEAWEALSKEEKILEVRDMKSPVIELGKGKRITQLDDNTMWSSNFEMYKRFVDKEYLTPKDKGVRHYTLDNCVQEYNDVREFIQWKKIDMRLQREENDASYTAGIETSWGNANTKNDILDSHGVMVKLQNGKDIKANHIEQIKENLNQVYTSFGDRSSMAKNFGLKISHSGEKKMFASKALGMYIPSMKAIGVSNNQEHDKFGFTLAHEFAHFMDNYVGKKQGRNYASDNYSSTAGKIAFEFRRNMNKKSDSDYVNKTAECFARSLEQYHAMKTEGDDVIKSKAHGIPYHQSDDHVNKHTFNTKIAPLIEQFLSENDHLLKSEDSELFQEIEIIEKAENGDPSHGGKLIKVTRTSHTGKKTSKWVLPSEAEGEVAGAKKDGHNVDIKHKKLSEDELKDYAKNSSESALKATITDSADPKLRKIAHDELDRRSKKEAVQKKEEKK